MDNLDEFTQILNAAKGQSTDKQIAAFLASQAASLARITDLLEKLLTENNKSSLHARPLVGHDSWGAK